MFQEPFQIRHLVTSEILSDNRSKIAIPVANPLRNSVTVSWTCTSHMIPITKYLMTPFFTFSLPSFNYPSTFSSFPIFSQHFFSFLHIFLPFPSLYLPFILLFPLPFILFPLSLPSTPPFHFLQSSQKIIQRSCMSCMSCMSCQ